MLIRIPKGSVTQSCNSPLVDAVDGVTASGRIDFAKYKFEHGYMSFYICIKNGITELELGKKVKYHFFRSLFLRCILG